MGQVSWSNITHKPELYTKSEIDAMLENFVSDDVYTKSEVDVLLAAIKIDIDENKLNTMLAEVLI